MSESHVCGTRREPECDPVDTGAPLSPDDFGIPHARCFAPGQLAPYFRVSARTIIRMCDDGKLDAIRIGAEYRIPYIAIVRYFLRQQGAFN